MQRSPRRQIPREKLTGCSYTEIIPCSVKGSNKMGLRVHAPYSRTLRVKHQKRGVTQCRGHPRRQIPREKLTGCSYTEIIPCSVKGSNKMDFENIPKCTRPI